MDSVEDLKQQFLNIRKTYVVRDVEPIFKEWEDLNERIQAVSRHLVVCRSIVQNNDIVIDSQIYSEWLSITNSLYNELQQCGWELESLIRSTKGHIHEDTPDY